MYFITEPGFCQHFFGNIFEISEKERLFFDFTAVFLHSFCRPGAKSGFYSRFLPDGRGIRQVQLHKKLVFPVQPVYERGGRTYCTLAPMRGRASGFS